MPRAWPPEFGARAVALVRAGKQVNQTAHELGIGLGCLLIWVRQDQIDPGEPPRPSTSESAEMRAARKRIRALGTKLADVKTSGAVLEPDQAAPKRDPPGDRRLAHGGTPVDIALRVLGVSRQGYYRYKRRPLSPTAMRRQWLSGLIQEVHSPQGHPRLPEGARRADRRMKVQVSSRLVSVLMTQAGSYGRMRFGKRRVREGEVTGFFLRGQPLTTHWIGGGSASIELVAQVAGGLLAIDLAPLIAGSAALAA